MDCQPQNPLCKPVLDQGTFQQLLSAAYTLQEQNNQLAEKANSDFLRAFTAPAVAERLQRISLPSFRPETLSEIKPPVKLALTGAQSDAELSAFLNVPVSQEQAGALLPDLLPDIPPVSSYERPEQEPAQLALAQPPHAISSATNTSAQRSGRKPGSQNNEVFWRVAAVAAMSAVFTLLLGASIERFSPLPARLKMPTEATQQQPPFRKAQPVVTVLAHSGDVSAKPSEIEPNVTPERVLTEPIIGAEQPAKKRTKVGWARKTVVHRTRPSVYDSEANLVAPDTVVRYDPQTGARLQQPNRR